MPSVTPETISISRIDTETLKVPLVGTAFQEAARQLRLKQIGLHIAGNVRGVA